MKLVLLNTHLRLQNFCLHFNTAVCLLQYIFFNNKKVEDNEKKLKCEYIQEENGQVTKTASTEIVFTPISKQILPKSPFKLTEIFEVGADAEIKLNLELFPEPNYDNYRWVIETDETLELPTGKK